MTDNRVNYNVHYAPLGATINEHNLVGTFSTREEAEKEIRRLVDLYNEIDEYTLYDYSDYVIE